MSHHPRARPVLQAIAFHYCFKDADDHRPTCGRSPVKALHGKPEHYYTSLEYIKAGEVFTVPFGKRFAFRWAECPRRDDGAFYNAISRGAN